MVSGEWRVVSGEWCVVDMITTEEKRRNNYVRDSIRYILYKRRKRSGDVFLVYEGKEDYERKQK